MKLTSRGYEPPLSVEGSEIAQLELLYPTVRGYAIKTGDLIYIPLIVADEEGSGAVGQFLDVISERCRIVNVTSDRLVEMLRRRKFTCRFEEGVDIWAPPN